MSEDVADLLSELSRQFRVELRQAMNLDKAQTTPFQNEVLACVGRNPGANPNSLSDITGRDKGQITRIIAELEILGLLRREKSASDRRSVSVNLTQSGEEVFQRVLAKRAALSDKMLSSLSAKDRSALVEMLRRMRSDLHMAVDRAEL
ncbi:MarR family winged helix-turn-helix transcriptional regulator [Microvirga zambiensis]|uniref:MarR family winged helix-turn-helix transcriptional regulator n=1 Tax=Microvirga zambiensis TaxID=1402137 RepID=UPI00191F6ADE|nr:MarR family transcriptional regulator [Microvirga zambiensis]